jgi:phosphoglycerate kinase
VSDERADPPDRGTFTRASVRDAEVEGRVVLVRCDLNVPVRDGSLEDDTRVHASLPTLRLLRERGARIVCVSHLGRPKEGVFDEAESLAPVAQHLSALLGMDVPLKRDDDEGETKGSKQA